jgi:hypothetical protein
LDEIRKTCEVSRYIIRISPPHAEGAISWLKNLHTAFVRATDVSTFVEFEGDLRPGIDSEPSLARAELIFEYLRAQLDETQPLTKEVALALGTLLAGGLRTSIAEKMLDVRDPAQAQTLVLREATAKHLLTVRDELLPYQIRLNQIRASGLWKLRTKILKLLGNSQA